MYLNIWFEKAKELNPGESIFLPVHSKKEQTEIARLLRELKNEYIAIDPEQAMSLLIDSMFKDGKHFVFIKKIYATPMIGFLRDNEGNMSKIDITLDMGRSRIITLMIKDGLPKEEIELNIGGLTEEELIKYFPEAIK
jgi:hypothetical protein